MEVQIMVCKAKFRIKIRMEFRMTLLPRVTTVHRSFIYNLRNIVNGIPICAFLNGTFS